MGNAKDRAGGGGGVDGVKNRSGKCEGPGRRGGDQRLFEKKSFFKNQKHQPNIVEITHLCIMHRVHTSVSTKEGGLGFRVLRWFVCWALPPQGLWHWIQLLKIFGSKIFNPQ